MLSLFYRYIWNVLNKLRIRNGILWHIYHWPLYFAFHLRKVVRYCDEYIEDFILGMKISFYIPFPLITTRGFWDKFELKPHTQVQITGGFSFSSMAILTLDHFWSVKYSSFLIELYKPDNILTRIFYRYFIRIAYNSDI